MTDSTGKIAIVTGASGGIGAEVARRMAAEGYTVVLTDIVEDGAATAKAIPGASFETHDVTTEEDWERVVQGAVAKHGRLDAIVNCAGYIQPQIDLVDMPLAVWRKHFAINTESAFLACKYGIRAMQEKGGAIVNFSSGLADLLIADAAPYCASKAAVITTTKLGAMAGAKHKVRVNCLLPGAVDTPMLYRNISEGQTPEQLLAFFAKQHPIGRVGTTTDMADAVLFLCSENSAFITGAALTIDGGQTL